MITMCQHRFLYYHKCITLLGDADNGGGHTSVRQEASLCTSCKFCCEPKTVLKNKVH